MYHGQTYQIAPEQPLAIKPLCLFALPLLTRMAVRRASGLPVA